MIELKYLTTKDIIFTGQLKYMRICYQKKYNKEKKNTQFTDNLVLMCLYRYTSVLEMNNMRQ